MQTSKISKFVGMLLLGLSMTLGAVIVSNAQQGDRWRVKTGGRYYNTDSRGTDVLRQAVREGYRQGFQAGQEDRRNRHRNNWKRNSVYRSANVGYDSHVGRSQYQYYFQQGFQKGYDDGFNSRSRYGSNDSILDNILNTIFKPQRY